jgi:hypothetical protein
MLYHFLAVFLISEMKNEILGKRERTGRRFACCEKGSRDLRVVGPDLEVYVLPSPLRKLIPPLGIFRQTQVWNCGVFQPIPDSIHLSNSMMLGGWAGWGSSKSVGLLIKH